MAYLFEKGMCIGQSPPTESFKDFQKECREGEGGEEDEGVCVWVESCLTGHCGQSQSKAECDGDPGNSGNPGSISKPGQRAGELLKDVDRSMMNQGYHIENKEEWTNRIEGTEGNIGKYVSYSLKLL